MGAFSTTTNTGPSVLVLSGGGVFGAAQAGMLVELAQAGYRPDVIVGVSAGALNGVAAAHEFSTDNLKHLIGIWSSIDTRDVFPAGTISQLIKVLTRHEGLHPGTGLENLVRRCCPVEDLSETPIPLYVGAVDVLTGRQEFWNSGPAVPALCASAALPGVVPPVKVAGRSYFDGGVVSNVPLGFALALNPSTVIVLDVSSPNAASEPPPTALAALVRAFAFSRQHNTRIEIASAESEHDRIRVLRPELPAVPPTDFSQGAQLASLGRNYVKEHLVAAPLVADPANRRARTRLPWTFAVVDHLRRVKEGHHGGKRKQ